MLRLVVGDAPAAWSPRRRWRRALRLVRLCVTACAIALGTAAEASAQVLTWNGPTRGSQNMIAAPTLALTTPGTYTITADVGMVMTFRGAAGGGGGASGYSSLAPTYGGWDLMYGGGGGGGGAVTTGTNVQLVAGRTYTLIVGAGGSGGAAAFSNTAAIANPGTAGSNTTLVNSTPNVTLVALEGGGRALGTTGGAGGTVTVGANAVTGGRGGSGAPVVSGSPVAGSAGGPATAGGGGSSVASGAGGGGGGGAGDNDSGSASLGGRGGNGSQLGGSGGGAPGAPGGNNGGLAAQGGGVGLYGGGGGGGGGGASFAGIAGAFGGGGGGGGGTGTFSHSTAADGSSGRGGSGQPGVAILTFVSTCALAPSPVSATVPSTTSTGSIALTTASGCAWTATSTASWLTIAAGSSGTGSGTIAVSAAANATGVARVAKILIGSETVTLTQAAGSGSDPLLTWSGPTSGSQNLATLPRLAFTVPGTYTVSVNNAIALAVSAVAGGGGGGSNGYSGDGGGGGGGGARVSDRTLQLVPGKTYELIVGGGGLPGTPASNGGATKLTNVSDAVPLLALGGGSGGTRQTAGAGGGVLVGDGIAGSGGSQQAAGTAGGVSVGDGIGGSGGSQQAAGAGGSVLVGDGIAGGNGGHGSRENTGVRGGQGTHDVGGTGGGGGGGGFDQGAGSGYLGGDGGGGSSAGAGAPPGSSGGYAGGLAASGGGSGGTDGGGGGGGGGVTFAGVSGAYGGGGGGAGGSNSAHRSGGGGQGGAAVFVAPCAYNVAPFAIASPAAGATGTLTVRAGACAWSATSTASWLTIAAGASGTGSGSVSYRVASNLSGGPRSASLSIGGQNITVTQSAIDRVIVSPPSSTLTFRDSQTLTAIAYDPANVALPNVPFTWKTSNSAIVSISGSTPTTAIVRAIGTTASPVTITATAASGQSGSANVTVTPGRVLVFDPFGGQAGMPIAQHQPAVNQLNRPWVVSGSPGVLVGGGAYPSGPGDGTITATIDAGAADASVSADWQPASTDNAYGGIVFRRSDASNYWVAFYYSTNVYLSRRVDGTLVTIGEAEVGPRQVRHLEVRLASDSIQVWSDGELKLATRSWLNAAATEHGLEWWNRGDPWSSLANFEVDGTLAPPVSSIVLSLPSMTMAVDAMATIAATPLDASGRAVPGASVSWSSSNPSPAPIAPATSLTATIAAREIGSTTIRAVAPRGPAGGAAIAINVVACVDALPIATTSAPPAGGLQTLMVTSAADCIWHARSEVDWLRITAGATVTGPGLVAYTVDPNLQAARVGTVVVGGRRLTVSQNAAPCAFSVWPGSGRWNGDGGSGGFDVTTTNTCGWTASTGAPWIHVSTTDGSGSSTVWFTVETNPTGAMRSGTIAIGGYPSTVLYTVTQDAASGASGGGGGSAPASGGCSFALDIPVATVPTEGGEVVVGVLAAPGCRWSAATAVDWINVQDPFGSGSGPSRLWVTANDAAETRAATVLYQDRLFAIVQDGTVASAPPVTTLMRMNAALAASSACTYTLAPSLLTVSAAGGSARVRVMSQAGCPWNAATDSTWFSISPEAIENSGAGTLVIIVQANPSALARSGLLLVGGQPFIVHQNAIGDGVPGPSNISWINAPDESKVDNCRGNCGDGCSGQIKGSLPAPCGGTHEWTYTLLSAPVFTGRSVWENTCRPGRMQTRTRYDVFEARARWSFRGRTSAGCNLHDGICRNTNELTCFISVPIPAFSYCEDIVDKIWIYDGPIQGLGLAEEVKTDVPCPTVK